MPDSVDGKQPEGVKISVNGQEVFVPAERVSEYVKTGLEVAGQKDAWNEFNGLRAEMRKNKPLAEAMRFAIENPNQVLQLVRGGAPAHADAGGGDETDPDDETPTPPKRTGDSESEKARLDRLEAKDRQRDEERRSAELTRTVDDAFAKQTWMTPRMRQLARQQTLALLTVSPDLPPEAAAATVANEFRGAHEEVLKGRLDATDANRDAGALIPQSASPMAGIERPKWTGADMNNRPKQIAFVGALARAFGLSPK